MSIKYFPVCSKYFLTDDDEDCEHDPHSAGHVWALLGAGDDELVSSVEPGSRT